jgi:hypothetical protein
MRRYSPTQLVCMVVLAAACADDEVLCSPLRPEAVAVDVREAGTNLPLAHGARGAAQIGEHIDSLVLDRISELPDSVLVGGSSEGVYEVRVEHEGYAPWSQGDVHARLSEGSPCREFETEVLTAELQPIEGASASARRRLTR